jgi:protein-L-isoaspartate(D-aspartate) O-methyltransferase
MSQVNIEQARLNMIEQQIRPWEVLDQQVLDAIREIPREKFVPEAWRNLAFADFSIPLEHGQLMMPPRIEARLLQAVAVKPFETVLEVGTGSGYLSALLARFAKHVYSVDLHQDFITAAAARLAALGITNATLEQGDAADGWDAHGPYDVIVLTGSAPHLPEAFRDSLRPHGRLFAIIGEPPVMEARLRERGDHDGWSTETLFETDAPTLENIAAVQEFSF